MFKSKLFLMMLLYLPATILAADATPSCLRKIEVGFFDGVYLEQAMNLHRVGQSSWNLIKSELARRSVEVPKLVYLEGSKRRPNPIDYPFQPKEAEKILMSILYTIFRETLNNFDIMNNGDIRDMFDYVRAHQQDRLNKCLYHERPRR